jgi:hypothetical protein
MTSQSQEDALDFVDGLISAVREDVDDSLEEFSDEECTQFVRDFVDAIESFRDKRGEDASSLVLVARSMYYAEMFSHAFKRAYLYSNKYVAASKSLEKVFNDDSTDS